MFEYLRQKLEQLVDSLFDPLWRVVLASPWWVRASVLIVLAPIAYGLYSPESAQSTWKLSSSAFRAARGGEARVPIASKIRDKMREVGLRLGGTVQGDVEEPNPGRVTPWSLSQEVLASSGLGERIHIDKQRVIAFIRANADAGCSCWREIPSNSAFPHNIFISGWILATLARIGEPATPGEIDFLLSQQNRDGWWPTFPVDTDSQFASTYSTAWALLGLQGQLTNKLLEGGKAQQVAAAIQKGSAWLLAQREHGTRWKAYPQARPDNRVSDSISGVVLHALHQTAGDRLREVDGEWLDTLPAKIPSTSDTEGGTQIWINTKDGEAADAYVQIQLPWLLIGTADAYANGGLLQRARALAWMEEGLTQPSIAGADTARDNWWRAELLYAIVYVLGKSGST